MDVISSLECLKLDSQSKVLHKDGVGRDLILPVTVPLNCDTPIIGECLYCVKVGDHISYFCPYKSDVPKNAIVGSGCVVNCKVCGCRFRGSCCAKCGSSQGRAILKSCSECEKEGEHMSYECPSGEKKYYPSVVFKCDPYTSAFSFEYAPLKEGENGDL